jgi:hypothetical protein
MTAQAESPEERFMGWPAAGRPEARVRLRDRQERVVSAASPVLEQEGRITPTEAFYVFSTSAYRSRCGARTGG